YDLRADLTLLTTNKMSGGQQLFGSNNLVIAGREQENRASYCRKINRASECCETPSCKLIVFVEPLNDLEIIGSGEIDGGRVPFAKERDQPQAARRSDTSETCNRPRIASGSSGGCFQTCSRCAPRTRPSPSSTNCLNTEVGTLWATRDSSDSLALMSTGAPA